MVQIIFSALSYATVAKAVRSLPMSLASDQGTHMLTSDAKRRKCTSSQEQRPLDARGPLGSAAHMTWMLCPKKHSQMKPILEENSINSTETKVSQWGCEHINSFKASDDHLDHYNTLSGEVIINQILSKAMNSKRPPDSQKLPIP